MMEQGRSRQGEELELLTACAEREAGVAELFELYSRVEAVYAAALPALEESRPVLASASANIG